MARTKKSAPAKASTSSRSEDDKGASKSKLSTAEARREYQRRYYQMHKEVVLHTR